MIITYNNNNNNNNNNITLRALNLTEYLEGQSRKEEESSVEQEKEKYIKG